MSAVELNSTPSLPRSIWVVAWASLAGQALLLSEQGVRFENEVSLVVSVALGALLVAYVSSGVVRARTVRLVLAWIVLLVSLVVELIALPEAEVLDLLSLGSTIVTVAALAVFSRTHWFAWQRDKPSTRQGASIAGLVAVAVLVGVLGGLTGPVDDGVQVDVRVAGS